MSAVELEACPCGSALKECPCGCKSPWCGASNNFVWNCHRPRADRPRQVTPLSQVILPAQYSGNYSPKARAAWMKKARRARAESERAGSLDSYGSDDEDEGGR